MRRYVVRVSRRTSLAVISVAYAWTLAVCWAVASFLPVESPLIAAAVLDLVATAMIFVFSVSLDNSSMYDPFWSVAPICLTGYWALAAREPSAVDWRAVAVVVLVAIWGLRLTANFLVHWPGLHSEDWRYEAYRERAGRGYWIVSFFGFHLVPTIIVFAACVPAYFACTSGRPVGLLDAAAAAVTCAAIVIETVADAQMRRAVSSRDLTGATFRGGLWGRCRHPNYLGEILFWWGIWLFALAADSGLWWTVVGPLGVTLLFLVVSLPLIERRMLDRRPDYARIRDEIPMLIPRLGPARRGRPRR